MLKNEIEIMKAVSIAVDENTTLVATYQYHTETKIGPDGKEVYGATGNAKSDRSKSYYCWKGKVWDNKELEAAIADLKSDAKRMLPWMWSDSDRFVTLYDNNATNAGYANWLSNKAKKRRAWEEGLEILKGFKKKTPKNPEPRYNKAAAFDLDGYVSDDGTVVSLTDREGLLKLKGQTLLKEIKMKSREKAAEEKAPAPVVDETAADFQEAEPVAVSA